MKKPHYILLSSFLTACFCVFSFIAEATYVLNDFTRQSTVNFTEGSNTDTFSGTVYKRAPWLKSQIVPDRQRSMALKINYDVTIGAASFVMNIAQPALLAPYSGITFYIKGTASFITVVLTGLDGIAHEYTVEGLTQAWQQVTIPFRDFSQPALFRTTEIASISFTVSTAGAGTGSGRGTFFLDDVALVEAGISGGEQEAGRAQQHYAH